jgi:peptide chain release factor 1
LYKMYTHYFQNQGWKQKLINATKEIVVEVKGENCFEKMKDETGVHRVQRVPTTEKKGRIHTSTVTVAVLPVKKKQDLVVDKKDLKFEFFCAGGAGGQHVNKTCSAVRITHIPTGIVSSSQSQRSQHQNRDTAMQVLIARLEQKKQQEESTKLSSEMLSQIGSGDRSEKIKTYNYPQDRLTDHRMGKSYYGIKKIMAGNIENIIEDYQNFVKSASRISN